MSLWKSTLAEFQIELAGTEPAPAGVSIAAVSSTLALSLLVKTLEITAKKSARPAALIEKAHSLSVKLAELADRDAAAFDEYLRCLRLPKENGGRAEQLASAGRATIEIPLEAARCAAAGIALCAEAANLVNAFVAPDLGAATALLHGAMRAILVSVDFNLQTLASDDTLRVAASAERISLEARASQAAAGVLRKIST